jgi:hypothetical protein
MLQEKEEKKQFQKKKRGKEEKRPNLTLCSLPSPASLRSLSSSYGKHQKRSTLTWF